MKKQICLQVEITFQTDPKFEIKESKNLEKYQDLARSLKIWNTKVTVIPIIVETIAIISKDREKRLGNRNSKEELRPVSTAEFGKDTLHLQEFKEI